MGLPQDLFASLDIKSQNFYFCQVSEKHGVVLDPRDKGDLLNQMDRLIRDIDKRWKGGCYYSEVNFCGYDVVQKYVKALQFAPYKGGVGPRFVHIAPALPSSAFTPPKTARAVG